MLSLRLMLKCSGTTPLRALELLRKQHGEGYLLREEEIARIEEAPCAYRELDKLLEELRAQGDTREGVPPECRSWECIDLDRLAEATVEVQREWDDTVVVMLTTTRLIHPSRWEEGWVRRFKAAGLSISATRRVLREAGIDETQEGASWRTLLENRRAALRAVLSSADDPYEVDAAVCDLVRVRRVLDQETA